MALKLKEDLCDLDEGEVDSIEIDNNFLLVRDVVGGYEPVHYKYKLVHFDEEFGDDWINFESVEAGRVAENGDDDGRPTIRRLPDNFGSGFNKLLRLNLRGNRDLQLPDGFGSGLSQLQFLDLAYTNLQCLPDDFGVGWPKLCTLYLDNNQLVNLPNDFGAGWVELGLLDLHNNNITELPNCFGACCSKLRMLDLSDNQLVNLPNDFGAGWVELGLLDLHNNKITELPNCFGACCSKLRALDLSDNQLVNLPNDFGVGWVELVKLILNNNNITALPTSITSINPEVNLYWDGNRLCSPPLEVCDKGLKAIRDYFQSLDDSVAVSPKRLKLIFVGESLAGMYANIFIAFTTILIPRILLSVW